MLRKIKYLFWIIFLFIPVASVSASVTVDEYECVYTPVGKKTNANDVIDTYVGVPVGFGAMDKVYSAGIENYKFPSITSGGTPITLTFTYDTSKKMYKVTASSNVNSSDEDIYIVNESAKTKIAELTKNSNFVYYGTSGNRASSDDIKCPNIRIFGYCSDGFGVWDEKSGAYTNSSGCLESHALISMYDSNDEKGNISKFLEYVLPNKKNYLYFSKQNGNSMIFEFGDKFTAPAGDSLANSLVRIELTNPELKITKKYGDTPNGKMSKDMCCYYKDASGPAVNTSGTPYIGCKKSYDSEFEGNFYKNYCEVAPHITVTYKLSVDGQIKDTTITKKEYKLYYLKQYAKVFNNENSAPSEGLVTSYILDDYKIEGYYLDPNLTKKYNASNLKANDNITIYIKLTKNKSDDPSPSDDEEWDESEGPAVNINDSNAMVFRKQCKYNATLAGSDGVTNVPTYFYTSYNWSFSSLDDDPTVSATNGGPDSAYPVSSDGNFKIGKFKTYENSGKWIPVSGASFVNVSDIYVMDGIMEKLKEFILTLDCSDTAQFKCSDMSYKTLFSNYAGYNGKSKYGAMVDILNGAVRNKNGKTFEDLYGSDYISKSARLSFNSDPSKNYCSTLNGKVWYPTRFYACQNNIYEYGDGVFTVYGNGDQSIGKMYIFTNKDDYDLFCDNSGGVNHLHNYVFEADSSERHSSQYKIPQSVELKCEFEQDYYKDFFPTIDKALANLLGFCSGNCTSKGSFSFVFGKDGTVKYTKGRGVGDLDIKFYFNNQEIESIYSVSSPTNVLDLNMALNLLVSDAGAYRQSKLGQATFKIAIGIAVTGVGIYFSNKIKAPFLKTIAKAGSKVIGIGVAGFFATLDFIEIFNTFSSRESRTVFLTNYFQLDSDTLNKFAEKTNQEKGYPYFEQFTLSKSTSQFSCTVSPYTGDAQEDPVEPIPVDCGIFSGKFGEIVSYILNILRIIGVVLMIVLGVLDFTKALTSSDADAMKKAVNMFVKRLIIVVLILFIPAIIDLLFSIIDKTSCSSTIGGGK